ncbi:ACT domain-containing protein [Shewanella saliphila]|uniref:Transporter n=1 Tax=Shewanella saliphila TaxID=2282698 RepID=A0ABQ2Q9V6_9GAMM|nr:ACT domain-containing protein [Shewanella saliphila]MCL1103190.1 ACT domain-containing protein [Shewanella saliphila]GGP66991.1 transporter [Shewanella saliphila]
MSGTTDLALLLTSMSPKLMDGEFVFCTVQGEYEQYAQLNPLATFCESEGLTLVVNKEAAMATGLAFDACFKQITLTVHSSLEAVGLTAAVAAKLTEFNISANVIAAYYHDHIFVPTDKAQLALTALAEFNQ